MKYISVLFALWRYISTFVKQYLYKYMESLRYKTREEIKARLRHNDLSVLAEMLKGKLTYLTIAAQLRGDRTLKYPVAEAANKLIQSREQLLENE